MAACEHVGMETGMSGDTAEPTASARVRVGWRTSSALLPDSWSWSHVLRHLGGPLEPAPS